MKNPFKIGDKVCLKMSLADAIKLDHWIGIAGVKENTSYTVIDIDGWRGQGPFKDGKYSLLLNDCDWRPKTFHIYMNHNAFKFSKICSVGFVIED
jgi:hypothetical protein